MKILHLSNFAPRRSGLYECAKDQIKYERKLGHDSQMAIYEIENPPDHWEDGDLKPVSWDWAEQADLYIIHRGLPEKIKVKWPKKTIMVIHGTSEFLLLEEVFTKAQKTPFNTHINLISSCDASVAVNEHDYNIYKIYDRDNKLSLIHDAIDMDKFSIDGYKHDYMKHPQILFADSLRVNKNPAHILWAMPEIVKKIPLARLSILGLNLETILTWRNLILRSPNRILEVYTENIQLEVTEIRPYMRGADILYNGNMSGISSRVEMEAMACGCQIISYAGKFTQWHPEIYNIKDIANKVIDCWEYIQQNPTEAKKEMRKYALENFSMKQKVQDEYIPLYHKILKK